MVASTAFLMIPILSSLPQPLPAGSSPVSGVPPVSWPLPRRAQRCLTLVGTRTGGAKYGRKSHFLGPACSLDGSFDGSAGKDGVSGGGNSGKTGGTPVGGSFGNSSYAVPMGRPASGIIRPLGEILRDLNKRVPSNVIDPVDRSIHWYHANRLLSFYAPGWCGEVRNVIFSGDGSVTVVYRVTIRGSDGEAHRESTGTVSSSFGKREDLVEAAEAIAFCRACSRFGLGLYLYHDDGSM